MLKESSDPSTNRDDLFEVFDTIKRIVGIDIDQINKFITVKPIETFVEIKGEDEKIKIKKEIDFEPNIEDSEILYNELNSDDLEESDDDKKRREEEKKKKDEEEKFYEHPDK